MLTKAEIQSIDFTSNTCVVRMPYFENGAGGDNAIATAIISTTPGVYNGYKVGDMVIVGFDNGQLQTPCVIGKLYLGASAESQDNRGSINCTTLNVSNGLSLPIDTKITSDNTEAVKVDGSANTYDTLKDALNAIKLNTDKIAGLSGGGSMASSAGTIMCRSLTANIYGYSMPAYSTQKVSVMGGSDFYYILYQGNNKMSEAAAKTYMNYMAGTTSLPISDNTKYNVTFVTADHKIYYPVWDGLNGYLKLIIVNDESLTDLIKRIVEEMSTPILVTDLSGEEESTISGRGVEETDATSEQHTTTSSLRVEVEDLT